MGTVATGEAPTRWLEQGFNPKEVTLMAYLATAEALRAQVLTQREVIHSILDPAGAEKVWLIGSVARAEERPDSDIDFVVTFRRGTTFGDLEEAEEALEGLLHRRVDIVSAGGLLKGDEKTFMAGAVVV
jgi:predicted nucleotidyltransferase